VGADGPDHLRQVLHELVGPHVALAQGLDPVIEHAPVLLIEGLDQPLADLGALGHLVDDLAVPVVHLEVLGHPLCQEPAAAAGQPRNGDHGTNRLLEFLLLVQFPLLGLILYDRGQGTLGARLEFHVSSSLSSDTLE